MFQVYTLIGLLSYTLSRCLSRSVAVYLVYMFSSVTLCFDWLIASRFITQTIYLFSYSQITALFWVQIKSDFSIDLFLYKCKTV